MRSCRRGLLAAALTTALTACSPMASGPPDAGRSVVLAREDVSPAFIGFIGPKAQHAPPFLDTAGTNFYCLRSFLDRRTGETTHQLYVSDSYFGIERNWNAARDSTGTELPFVAVSRDEIACDTGCPSLPSAHRRGDRRLTRPDMGRVGPVPARWRPSRTLPEGPRKGCRPRRSPDRAAVLQRRRASPGSVPRHAGTPMPASRQTACRAEGRAPRPRRRRANLRNDDRTPARVWVRHLPACYHPGLLHRSK